MQGYRGRYEGRRRRGEGLGERGVWVLFCREIGSLEGEIEGRVFGRELEVRELASRVVGVWKGRLSEWVFGRELWLGILFPSEIGDLGP